VDRARQHLLARAGLTEEEDRQERRGYPREALEATCEIGVERAEAGVRLRRDARVEVRGAARGLLLDPAEQEDGLPHLDDVLVLERVRRHGRTVEARPVGRAGVFENECASLPKNARMRAGHS
jgi:hypothetical protein